MAKFFIILLKINWIYRLLYKDTLLQWFESRALSCYCKDRHVRDRFLVETKILVNIFMEAKIKEEEEVWL